MSRHFETKPQPLSQILEALVRLWKTLVTQGRRRKPPSFDLPAPLDSPELKQVWHICDSSNPDTPVSVDLAGLAQVWLKGWFATEQDLSPSDRELKLYFNGELVKSISVEHMPENAPEIGGVFAVFLALLPFLGPA